MTYRYEVHRLAKAVSTLLVRGGKVPPDDVPAALAGHLALVELITVVHRDLAPEYRPDDALQALERNPVAVLGEALARQPRRMDAPITSVLMTLSASRAGRDWREVAAAATVAEHDWRTGYSLARVQQGFALAELADMASLAQAVTVLDTDVADSLSRIGRLEDASLFRGAARSGLRIAAREVYDVATSHTLPNPADVVPKESRLVLPVRRDNDIPRGLQRLGHLLRTDTSLSPAHLGLAMRTVAQSSLTAASSLAEAGDYVAAATLRTYADHLARAVDQTRWAATVTRSDGHVLAQAQQVHQQLTRMRDLQRTPDLELSRGMAISASGAGQHLASIAEGHLSSGRWLVRTSGADLGWAPAVGAWQYPALHGTLTRLPLPPLPTIKRPIPRSARTLISSALTRAKPRPDVGARLHRGR